VVRYAAREIEVRPLPEVSDPHHVELCSDHAARLTPPRGWTLAVRAVSEPVGA
jgi:uncharacterized protein DUF3499